MQKELQLWNASSDMSVLAISMPMMAHMILLNGFKVTKAN